MSTDLFKQVLFNDGEGLAHSDINDTQRYLGSVVSDQILQNLIGGVGLSAVDQEFAGVANPPTHLAYTLHGGQAFLRLGSGNNKLQIAPGTLFQKTGNSDGSAPTLLAYTFAGTEEVSIAAGDGANPRVDLLQMKLEMVSADTQSRDFEDAATHIVTTTSMYKKYRVQCTLSVKQGTPAASPTYPDPDTGYVAVAGIVVGTSYATGTALIFGKDSAGANAVVHDQRMPFNVQSYVTKATEFAYPTGGTWALDTGRFSVTATGTTDTLKAQCPKMGAFRLVGFQVWKAATNALGTVYIADRDSPASSKNGLTIGANGSYQIAYYTFEGAHTPEAGPTVQQSATNKIGCPLWGNGRRVAIANAASVAGTLVTQLWCVMAAGTTGQQVYDVRWVIAEGI